MATQQQKRFGAASRTCMASSSAWPAFGRCMKSELGGRKKAKKRRKKRRKGR
jgi:hypothetical protein